MFKVEIIETNDITEVARQIELGLNHGYDLAGSVNTSFNKNGNKLYLATMVKKLEEDDSQKGKRGRE